MKELTCIVCPRGCRLTIDDELNVTGNSCPRGAQYAKDELTNPKRMITSFVRVKNRENTVVSVKTSTSIPKGMIFDVMNEIDKVRVTAPTKIGDVAIKNVLNTGADIIITKKLK
jgi:CxxC motif-containing protein